MTTFTGDDSHGRAMVIEATTWGEAEALFRAEGGTLCGERVCEMTLGPEDMAGVIAGATLADAGITRQ